MAVEILGGLLPKWRPLLPFGTDGESVEWPPKFVLRGAVR
jgi:hypothetical protein